MIQDAALQARKRLLTWYRKNARDLPWRRTRDPYAVWLSEVMLQQTQVKVVLPYYERFLARFPTVESLAEALLSDVMAIWSGLGYYRRAGSLHRTAKIVVARYGGQMPDTARDLERLPGIGRYTAGAIMSIAYGKPAIALDANAKRVLSRLFLEREERRIEATAKGFLPRKNAGEFNQALMELGAVVCCPQRPSCASCPVIEFCRAKGPFSLGKASPSARKVAWLYALVQRDEKVLACERPLSGLLGGLMDLPWIEVSEPISDADAARKLCAHLRSDLGLIVKVGRKIQEVSHAVSGRKVTAKLFPCEPSSTPIPAGWSWLAVGSMEELPLSSLTRRMLKGVSENGRRSKDAMEGSMHGATQDA
jgi:A/G-specific adenine glycosylase